MMKVFNLALLGLGLAACAPTQTNSTFNVSTYSLTIVNKCFGKTSTVLVYKDNDLLGQVASEPRIFAGLTPGQYEFAAKSVVAGGPKFIKTVKLDRNQTWELPCL
jgi:hypothetical protein